MTDVLTHSLTRLHYVIDAISSCIYSYDNQKAKI